MVNSEKLGQAQKLEEKIVELENSISRAAEGEYIFQGSSANSKNIQRYLNPGDIEKVFMNATAAYNAIVKVCCEKLLEKAQKEFDDLWASKDS